MMTAAVCVLSAWVIALTVRRHFDAREFLRAYNAVSKAAAEIDGLNRDLWHAGVEIRALTRQRDIAVEQAAEDAASYLRRIKALEERLAVYARKRGPGGRIVGRA